MQKMRRVLLESYETAVSSQAALGEYKSESNTSTADFGCRRMWERVCQFKATTCFAVSGKDQLNELLMRSASKELPKDEKDAAKKKAHATILNAATSASDAKTEVGKVLEIVGKVRYIENLVNVELRNPSFIKNGPNIQTAFLTLPAN